jgi:hypothetical protein
MPIEPNNARILRSSLRAKRSNPDSVIPGWSQRVGALRRPMTGSGPDPESRDSGFDTSHRPGMTVSGSLRLCDDAKSRPQTRVRDLATQSARVVHLSLALEGVGNAGCLMHPRPRVRFVVVRSTRVTTSTPERPAFPHAMVLTAYVVLSPVTGLFCHRRLRISFCLSPVGPTQLRELDASVGASGPHDFAVRFSIVRQRAV